MPPSFTERLEPATAAARRRVYELLWLELTIVGRIVWSEDDLPLSEKLDGLKWLNEIQHRVWGAHANAVDYSPTDLYATIQKTAEQASALRGVVDAACVRSLRALDSADSEE